MKQIKIYIYGVLFLLTGVVIASCEKTFDEKQLTQDNFSNSTIAQVIIAMVNANRNQIYVDGARVTGSPMVSGSIFPGTGYGFELAPGLRAIQVRDTLVSTTQPAFTFAENMQVARHQTIFVYDTITSPKQKTVVDDIQIPANNDFRLRFANFIYNATAVPAIDIYSFAKSANIFTNVAVTDVTPFINYTNNIPIDTLYIRETGTTVNIIKVSLNLGLSARRSYTLVYRGSHRGTRVATLYATR